MVQRGADEEPFFLLPFPFSFSATRLLRWVQGSQSRCICISLILIQQHLFLVTSFREKAIQRSVHSTFCRGAGDSVGLIWSQQVSDSVLYRQWVSSLCPVKLVEPLGGVGKSSFQRALHGSLVLSSCGS